MLTIDLEDSNPDVDTLPTDVATLNLVDVDEHDVVQVRAADGKLVGQLTLDWVHFHPGPKAFSPWTKGIFTPGLYPEFSK